MYINTIYSNGDFFISARQFLFTNFYITGTQQPTRGLVIPLSFSLGIDIGQSADYRRGPTVSATFNKHFRLRSYHVRATLL